MPVTYRPDYEAHIAYISGTGRVTFADCAALVRSQREDVVHRLHELNDYRNVELVFAAGESEQLARLNMELYRNVHDIRFAVVVASDVAYGLSRVFKAYLDDSVDFSIFTDFDEALAWVKEAASLEGIRT